VNLSILTENRLLKKWNSGGLHYPHIGVNMQDPPKARNKTIEIATSSYTPKPTQGYEPIQRTTYPHPSQTLGLHFACAVPIDNRLVAFGFG
jgi:hypothetical protein